VIIQTKRAQHEMHIYLFIHFIIIFFSYTNFGLYTRPLLGTVLRQGFYWPKAASDVADLVQMCEKCQKCARDQKQPSSLTQLI
jgi:hypothetical protein